MLPLLRSDIGGRALKIHPDERYGNLYRRLLGDDMFVRFQSGFELPSTTSSPTASQRTLPDVGSSQPTALAM